MKNLVRTPAQEVSAEPSGASYVFLKYISPTDFQNGCNVAARSGLKLHSWQTLLRPGAVEPQIYATFIKE